MMLKSLSVVSILLMTVSVVACGDKAGESTKSDTQVVAKVNGDEISIHQVNLQLGRAGKVDQAQSKAISQQIVTKLVDQQLLKQQAIEEKLDRDPRVLQILEASKSEILAQAYLEKISTKAKKPTTAEIDTFYNEHPELFEKRRVFRLQELVVQATPDKFAEIETGVKDIKNINEVAAWLKERQFQFTANSNVRAAEQLPGNLLKVLQPLNDGELFLIKSDRALNVVHLAASQSQPITREKATPVIEQYYLNLNKTNVIKDEMKALKDKAKIEYVGAFAEMRDLATTQPNDKTTTEAASSNTAPSTEESNKDATVEESTKKAPSSIDKGLSGL
ncbi:MAG: peptidyl-prolyl cis-trans isomerase, EpsD family [Methylophilaceae bacterium 17-44-8]|nr:MAG: peptidyl-prolyl cis-trans isomerase, EpsD family [Methylophilales bacterium 16-45-9]OZA06693.1 MAG: peptidyl-prolyl cis-trans isomerase, EpsD family [Methylophilaceae bacterium 17-44-8]